LSDDERRHQRGVNYGTRLAAPYSNIVKNGLVHAVTDIRYHGNSGRSCATHCRAFVFGTTSDLVAAIVCAAVTCLDCIAQGEDHEEVDQEGYNEDSSPSVTSS
jgi:hypothetical protein